MMSDSCSHYGCKNLFDIDGYDQDTHGSMYCDSHQPKCPVGGCNGNMFRGMCFNCGFTIIDRDDALNVNMHKSIIDRKNIDD